MHISCMAPRPCKPLWHGVSAVLRGWGFMQNHAPYACTRSLRQASQKKGCFRTWENCKAPQQNQHCSGANSISEVFDFGYNGGNDLMSFFPAAANHRRSGNKPRLRTDPVKKQSPESFGNTVGEVMGTVEPFVMATRKLRRHFVTAPHAAMQSPG